MVALRVEVPARAAVAALNHPLSRRFPPRHGASAAARYHHGTLPGAPQSSHGRLVVAFPV